MCGIVGIFGGDLNSLNSVNSLISHRGRDDDGIYINRTLNIDLRHVHGHGRLSIVDTSSFGHQLMSSDDGKVILAFNGKIYNHKELRSDLKRKGCSDLINLDTKIAL
jgi:asparagine synthase (glutamine-hydrolysing)